MRTNKSNFNHNNSAAKSVKLMLTSFLISLIYLGIWLLIIFAK